METRADQHRTKRTQGGVAVEEKEPIHLRDEASEGNAAVFDPHRYYEEQAGRLVVSLKYALLCLFAKLRLINVCM